jgi:hypothetical protein
MDEKRKGLSKFSRKLRNLLAGHGFLRDDSSDEDDGDDGDALVGAPIRPRPHLNSGAVALDLPDDPDY